MNSTYTDVYHASLIRKRLIRWLCLIAALCSLNANGAAVNEHDQHATRKHYAAATPVLLAPVSIPSDMIATDTDTEPDPDPDPDPEPEPEPDMAESVVTIDINSATAVQLANALPGIGPAKAQRIVDWRETNGPFVRIDQLIEVVGIGPITLERLRPLVRIGDAVAAAARTRQTLRREEVTRQALARIIDLVRSDGRLAR